MILFFLEQKSWYQELPRIGATKRWNLYPIIRIFRIKKDENLLKFSSEPIFCCTYDIDDVEINSCITSTHKKKIEECCHK